jgi:ribosomal protein L11 methyltransferase
MSLPASVVGYLETGEQTAHRIADAVAERFDGNDVAISLSDAGRGRWRVAIHVPARPDENAVRAAISAAAGRAVAATLRFAEVAEADWVQHSLAGLAPVTAGRFVVHGAHDRDRVAANRIGIEIEAALAFGTGHHGTTRGCLLALDRICKAHSKRPLRPYPEARAKRAAKNVRPFEGRASRGRLRVRRKLRVLDVGTGSGVLAMAAARALHQGVLATDIDATAVRAARDNIRRNRASGFVDVIKADGVGMRLVRAHAPFNLIFANILLGPLLRIAAALKRLTAPGARVVLSGILPAQANAVIAAYRPLTLERRLDLDGWTTLVFSRRKLVGRG